MLPTLPAKLFYEGVSVSMLCPNHPPPNRHYLPLGLEGGGGRIRSGAERNGQGCDYHEVDNDDEDNFEDGGRKGGKPREEVLMIVFHGVVYA
jgi:hypothetical protein